MKALVVEELAPDYAGCVLKEIPTPDPGPGEVQVGRGAHGTSPSAASIGACLTRVSAYSSEASDPSTMPAPA